MSRYPYLGPWEPLSRRDREAVDQAMATTEVLHLSDRLLGTLSGGERQRTLIAAALAQGGRVVLLDEPTSYLDYRHQVQVLDLLDHLHRDLGYTLVVVTHDLNATVGCSDSVLALKDGRVAFAGTPEGLLDVDRLAAIYENDFELVKRGVGSVPLVVPTRGGRGGTGQ
ncbi:MAG: ABC transporter ATP-binding protein, partial [Acidobacteria bacterium]|nr:ABC transporter ATP-binding protein [Acidobacteriota bacterium]